MIFIDGMFFIINQFIHCLLLLLHYNIIVIINDTIIISIHLSSLSLLLASFAHLNLESFIIMIFIDGIVFFIVVALIVAYFRCWFDCCWCCWCCWCCCCYCCCRCCFRCCFCCQSFRSLIIATNKQHNLYHQYHQYHYHLWHTVLSLYWNECWLQLLSIDELNNYALLFRIKCVFTSSSDHHESSIVCSTLYHGTKHEILHDFGILHMLTYVQQ